MPNRYTFSSILALGAGAAIVSIIVFLPTRIKPRQNGPTRIAAQSVQRGRVQRHYSTGESNFNPTQQERAGLHIAETNFGVQKNQCQDCLGDHVATTRRGSAYTNDSGESVCTEAPAEK